MLQVWTSKEPLVNYFGKKLVIFILDKKFRVWKNTKTKKQNYLRLQVYYKYAAYEYLTSTSASTYHRTVPPPPKKMLDGLRGEFNLVNVRCTGETLSANHSKMKHLYEIVIVSETLSNL